VSVESSPSIPFYATDHVGYNAIAKFVPEAGTELFHNFIVNELESSDGRPNIELVTIVANRMAIDHKASEFRKWMASKLPESLGGDQLALWLVAQAWVEEALAGGVSQAAVGLPYLEHARHAARGDEVRFRVLREIVFREITIGRSDVAFQQGQRLLFTRSFRSTLPTGILRSRRSGGASLRCFFSPGVASGAKA